MRASIADIAQVTDSVSIIGSVASRLGTAAAAAAADLLIQSVKMWVQQAAMDLRHRMIQAGAVAADESPTGSLVQDVGGCLMLFDFQPVGPLGLPQCVDDWRGSERWGYRISRKTALGLLGPASLASLRASEP